MFEITSDDIALLDDKKLRILIGYLCEADLRDRGHPTSAVTWGGHQNAKDGGLDVCVRSKYPIDGFIPRSNAGFQVKNQNMSPSDITTEMRPKGVLRPIFKELADGHAAYIIASSQGSVSESALASRRTAMIEAVRELPNANNLLLDFYDRNRLASWVRNHSGIAVWVRNAVGRNLQGWEPFGAWAYPEGGLNAEYLIDESIRICPRPASSDGDSTTVAGLEKIRTVLASNRNIVRIVGLSGVGKTRLVQALFDNRIGNGSLDPSLAIYTNMNFAPDPQPISLASDLIADGARAILVVDNCAADLHRRLSELVKTEHSKLSVLTIEYDIRDDQSEGTEVFEIQAASVHLIEALLQQRFPRLSQVNARTAAEFSGGNARIAIALADTVDKSGSLAGLSDDETFQRLFLQRQQYDKPLLEIAQACSLVYSYDGKNLSNTGELAQLGAMIGSPPEHVFSATSELLDRYLAQQRGVWRAILPHAIANKLASAALRKIPLTRIENNLINGASERLITSFARRIGYLHTSPEAQEIVRKWLEPNGWMGNVWNLNHFGKTIFQNVLPVDPATALAALEAGAPKRNPDVPIAADQYIPRALRSLAYDSELFDRSVTLLATLAGYGSEGIAKEAKEIHASLFYLYLSGSHASVEQRIAAARILFNSSNTGERKLGYAAMDAMLEAAHFSSHFDFKFGARSRDYGYQPKTSGEIAHWYRSALSAVMELLRVSSQDDAAIKSIIANNFRGLWASGHIRDELENSVLEIRKKEFWREGWLAVRQTRYFDEKDRTSENFARLSAIETALRPIDLIQNVRGRIFQNSDNSFSLYAIDEAIDDSTTSVKDTMEKQAQEAIKYGETVAIDSQALSNLLPEMVSSEGHLIWQFGAGLARGSKDPGLLWQALASQLANIPSDKRNIQVFRGMLSELQRSNQKMAAELLDDAVGNKFLRAYFPAIQMAGLLDRAAIKRLLLSLETEGAEVWMFGNLAFGGVTKTAAGDDLALLLGAIAKKANGAQVATRILHMRFFSDESDNCPHASELIDLGRELLKSIDYADGNSQADHENGKIAKTCLVGNGGHEAAIIVCNNLKRAFQSQEAYIFGHNELLRCIFSAQPYAALDTFLTGDADAIAFGTQIVQNATYHHPNPIMVVSDKTLLEWSKGDPITRFPMLASVINASTGKEEEAPPQWTPIALQLIQHAPNPIAVLRAFTARFRPTHWSGSRATILDHNAALLDQIQVNGNTALATFIESEKVRLKKEADDDRKWENEIDRERDERFE